MMEPEIGDRIQVAGVIHTINEAGRCMFTMLGELDGVITLVRPSGFVEFTSTHFGNCRVHISAITAITKRFELGPTWEEGSDVNFL